MGYYTGSGVVTSGGSSAAPFQTYLWNGFHTVFQRTVNETTTKAGVSLETAKGTGATCSLESYQFIDSGSYYNAFNCKGTKQNVTYSRIGDSNLYVMNISVDTLSAKFDNGGWVS